MASAMPCGTIFGKGIHMDIEMLYEFVDLAKTRSFQLTADNMYTSQSCISKHISKLEKELNVKLFDRSSRTVKLSSYGLSFVAYARQIIDLKDEALIEFREMQHKESRFLNIGFHPILGSYGVEELLTDFRNKHPQISTNLFETNSTFEMLDSFICDVIFAPDDTVDSQELQQTLYMHDRLAVFCPSGRPLAKEKFVTLEQLRDEAFITRSNPSSGPQSLPPNFLRICRKGGITPKISATANKVSTILKFVSQDMGIALLFRNRLPKEYPGIEIVDIEPEIPVNICAFYMSENGHSEAVRTFLTYLKGRNMDI